MVDDNQSEGRLPQLPPLREIEEAGEAAAFEIAHQFLNEAQATGGAIDGRQLEGAGPTVSRAYMRLLAKAVHDVAAASPTTPPSESVNGKHKPTTSVGDVDRAGDNRQPPSTQMARAELNWRSQKRAIPDLRSQSLKASAFIIIVVHFLAYLSYYPINNWLVEYYR